jgi:hypothetical protein
MGREFRQTFRVQKYNEPWVGSSGDTFSVQKYDEPWAGSSGKHSEFRNIMNHGQVVQVNIQNSEI